MPGLTHAYHTLNGRLIGETNLSTGVKTHYVTDALGSVSPMTASTYTRCRYKPYGASLSGTPGTFGWCGAWGYSKTGRTVSSHYVRARHYATANRLWTTVDPLWPIETVYSYCKNNPSTHLDPDGLSIAGTEPNCCIRNRPGILVNGRCRELDQFTLKALKHEACYIQRCKFCSVGAHNYGLQSALQDLVSAVAFGGMFACGEVADCIGDCSAARSVSLGCQQHGGGHGLSRVIHAGCCIQMEIDLCCLFATALLWSETIACKPQMCSKGIGRRRRSIWVIWDGRTKGKVGTALLIS